VFLMATYVTRTQGEPTVGRSHRLQSAWSLQRFANV
jgi:hypothetical protein